MKFNTFEQLVEYIGALGQDIQDLDIKISSDSVTESKAEGCSVDSISCKCSGTPLTETIDLAICSLYDEPIMSFVKGEDNLLVVENFECIPYTCGTSFVVINDRELKVNICEMDGVATTSLMIKEGEKKRLVKFKLSKDKTKVSTFRPE